MLHFAIVSRRREAAKIGSFQFHQVLRHSGPAPVHHSICQLLQILDPIALIASESEHSELQLPRDHLGSHQRDPQDRLQDDQQDTAAGRRDLVLSLLIIFSGAI